MGWDDVKSNNSDKTDINYLALTEGSHQIRFVEPSPRSRWTHWIQSANAGKGLTINCIGKGCPVCKRIADDKKNGLSPTYFSRKQHMMHAISRTSGEFGLVDKGNGLFDPLCEVMDEMKNEGHGDITNYDIKIRVSGKARDTKYMPIPMTVSPLTQAEKELELYNIDELMKPLTAEQVLALMQGATFKDIFGEGDVVANNVNDSTDEVVGSEEEVPNVDFTKSK